MASGLLAELIPALAGLLCQLGSRIDARRVEVCDDVHIHSVVKPPVERPVVVGSPAILGRIPDDKPQTASIKPAVKSGGGGTRTHTT